VSWIRRAIGRATHQRIETLFGQMVLERVGEYNFHFLLMQLLFELHQEFVHHAEDDFVIQRREGG